MEILSLCSVIVGGLSFHGLVIGMSFWLLTVGIAASLMPIPSRYFDYFVGVVVVQRSRYRLEVDCGFISLVNASYIHYLWPLLYRNAVLVASISLVAKLSSQPYY